MFLSNINNERVLHAQGENAIIWTQEQEQYCGDCINLNDDAFDDAIWNFQAA